MVFDRVFDTVAEIHVHAIHNGAFLIDCKAIHWRGSPAKESSSWTIRQCIRKPTKPFW